MFILKQLNNQKIQLLGIYTPELKIDDRKQMSREKDSHAKQAGYKYLDE